MLKSFSYHIHDKDIPVEVIFKRIRNIHYRYKEGKFIISAPYFTSEKVLVKGLDKFGEKLLKAADKPAPVRDDSFYFFGHLYPLKEADSLTVEGEEVTYHNQDELWKKLVEIYSRYLTEQVRHYEQIMNLKPYQIAIRKMKSRYGVNNRAKYRLTFATVLLHYPKEVIDSVIVHELAHGYEFNHSKKFYDVVYKYFPEYTRYHTQLRKGKYQDENDHK